MKKFISLLQLVLFLTATSPSLSAQMRERRVGPPSTSDTTSRPIPAPTRPPQQTSPVKTAPPSERGTEVHEEVGEGDVVRVSTALVTIPVSILDRDGRFISGLRKEDFRIFEDAIEQDVAYLASAEVPFTVALVLDTSASTRFKLDDIQSAAIAFLDQLSPNDSVMVVSFDDEIRVLAEPTRDRRMLNAAIRRTRTGGGTRLYDAVDMVIKKRLSRIKGRKAIVLFTDGVDTTSKRAHMRDNLRDAEELDALIYPIQYDTYSDIQTGGGGWPGGSGGGLGDIIGIIIGGAGRRGPIGGGPGTSREEYERAGSYLRELASLTGGRHHNANDLYYLERAFTNIAEELRRQYSLGYYPKRQSNVAERRQIKVRVKRPNLVVRARDNYVYRPADSVTGTSTQEDQLQRQPPELRRQQLSGAGTSRN
jgi:VWFA-related protein